jgi:hypothetical protein
MMGGTIEAKGLVEFNAALKRASEDVPQVVQRIALSVALIVVNAAVPTIPRRSGRAAKSVQGFASGQGANVTGGQGIEYYRWLELGGRSGRGLANVRPVRKDGRYINPAYERNKKQAQSLMETELTKALRAAGLGVT